MFILEKKNCSLKDITLYHALPLSFKRKLTSALKFGDIHCNIIGNGLDFFLLQVNMILL